MTPPRVNIMARELVPYAYNPLATTPNTPYQFRYETGGVTDRDENLYFLYDVEDRHLIVKGIGVRAPANLARTYVDVDGYPHPKSGGGAALGGPNTPPNYDGGSSERTRSVMQHSSGMLRRGS